MPPPPTPLYERSLAAQKEVLRPEFPAVTTATNNRAKVDVENVDAKSVVSRLLG